MRWLEKRQLVVDLALVQERMARMRLLLMPRNSRFPETAKVTLHISL
jgi:hypothetical protein